MNNKRICEQFKEWYMLYKKDLVRDSTLKKYEVVYIFLRNSFNNIKVKELNKYKVQEILNEYSKNRCKSTVKNFYAILKSFIIELFDNNIIKSFSFKNIVIKGKEKSNNRKTLSFSDVEKLVTELNFNNNYDFLVYILIKTGLRISEALALEKEDVDLLNKSIKISKAWDYINDRVTKTKNKSSNRIVYIDKKTMKVINDYINIIDRKYIFLEKKFYISVFNNYLKRRCKNLNINTVTAHGLRHTHASILFYKKVSVLSISKRLGHSNVQTTQNTYIHILKELEEIDNELIDEVMGEL